MSILGSDLQIFVSTQAMGLERGERLELLELLVKLGGPRELRPFAQLIDALHDLLRPVLSPAVDVLVHPEEERRGAVL